MKSKYGIIFVVIILLKCLSCNLMLASTFSAISVQNNIHQAIVTIVVKKRVPTYTIFSLSDPDRIVIDLSKVLMIQKKNTFPIVFSGSNLIKRIRTSTPINCQSVRIVCDLTHISNIKTIIQQEVDRNYCIILVISKKIIVPSHLNKKDSSCLRGDKKSCFVMFKNTEMDYRKKSENIHGNIKQNFYGNRKIFPITVAIDAGHGGHDPGATGYNGIYEKHITLSIAKKLKKLLDLDPRFKGVMIRNGDYFLSVMDRSVIARQKKSDILISIHTDSSINPKVIGASIWILSNRRVQQETVYWLKCREKYTELLGGLGYVLSNYSDDPYFSRLILDLQFGYVQKVGYDVAAHILNQLKNIGSLHKNAPEYSGFGILKSPDIPSILVETGFISNIQEGKLLSTDKYQAKMARALYQGLKSYFSLREDNYLIPYNDI